MKRLTLILGSTFVAGIVASVYCLLSVRHLNDEMPRYYNRGEQQMWQAEVQRWTIIGLGCFGVAILSMLILFIVIPIARIRRIRQQNDLRLR